MPIVKIYAPDTLCHDSDQALKQLSHLLPTSLNTEEQHINILLLPERHFLKGGKTNTDQLHVECTLPDIYNQGQIEAKLAALGMAISHVFNLEHEQVFIELFSIQSGHVYDEGHVKHWN